MNYKSEAKDKGGYRYFPTHDVEDAGRGTRVGSVLLSHVFSLRH
jgi:hypothetical protein